MPQCRRWLSSHVAIDLDAAWLGGVVFIIVGSARFGTRSGLEGVIQVQAVWAAASTGHNNLRRRLIHFDSPARFALIVTAIIVVDNRDMWMVKDLIRDHWLRSRRHHSFREFSIRELKIAWAEKRTSSKLIQLHARVLIPQSMLASTHSAWE